MKLDANYWSQRYEEQRTGWDIGAPAPQLLALAESLPKEARILIPGCGMAWEAEALFRQGYHEVFVCDWSPQPLQKFAQRCPEFPREHLLQGDFFSLHNDYPAFFDFVLEQTFFCAIPPGRRDAYAKQCHQILKPGGHIGGLLFDFPLTAEGPPFGGDRSSYIKHFSPWFEVHRLERSEQSIAPRANRELVFVFRKKD